METAISNDMINALLKELSCFKENIADYLTQYQDDENLDISYLSQKGFKYEGTKEGTIFIDKLRSFFHKKEIDFQTSLWIINKWGRIGSFQDNDTNIKRINSLQNGLDKRKFTKDLFSVISSLSKIASFKDSEQYFVYDSKVIYTLNWLILKSNISNPKFFPMPASRSKKLTLFDLDTLINLFYKDKFHFNSLKKELFFDTKDAYFNYCILIKTLSKTLFPNRKPYHLEMLLFTIADNKIFDELRSSVKLSIK